MKLRVLRAAASGTGSDFAPAFVQCFLVITEPALCVFLHPGGLRPHQVPKISENSRQPQDLALNPADAVRGRLVRPAAKVIDLDDDPAVAEEVFLPAIVETVRIQNGASRRIVKIPKLFAVIVETVSGESFHLADIGLYFL